LDPRHGRDHGATLKLKQQPANQQRTKTKDQQRGTPKGGGVARFLLMGLMAGLFSSGFALGLAPRPISEVARELVSL
jgi:hypothetical protein